MPSDESVVHIEQWGRDQVLRDLRDDMKGVREVMNTFAQRSDVTAIAIKLEDMVPRREFDRENNTVNKRIDNMESSMKLLATKEDIKQLTRGPIASWLYQLIAVIATIAALFLGVKH